MSDTRYSAPERAAVIRHGDERAQLTAWLDFYRATILRKCDGLTIEQMRQRPLATSQMSLIGAVRHLSFVEQYWFEDVFLGRTVEYLYVSEEFPDGEWDCIDDASMAETFETFATSCETSRLITSESELDQRAVNAHPSGGETVDLRWILIHLIEEYARHCGHADILRELIDGVTGF